MDGVTDPAFRRVVATHGGPDVIFTEFTHVGDICGRRHMGWEPLAYSERERPILAQLYGKDPGLFYQATQVVCELGFDGVDINMGCPSKNVASSGSGAALIRTPDLALDIMASTRQAIADWSSGQTLAQGGVKPSVIEMTKSMNTKRTGKPQPQTRRNVPLSVKTRLGYDKVVIDEWSDCLAQGNPEVLSIHGRTLAQMYRGEADWEGIAAAALKIRAKGILVLGNGDIRSLDEAVWRIQTSSVDGVLIGRGALGNPWIFLKKEAARQAVQQSNGGLAMEPPIALEDRFRMILEHAEVFETLNGKERFPRMRKHLGWYCTGFPHAAALRAHMVRTTCLQDVEGILADYWKCQHGNEEAFASGLRFQSTGSSC